MISCLFIWCACVRVFVPAAEAVFFLVANGSSANRECFSCDIFWTANVTVHEFSVLKAWNYFGTHFSFITVVLGFFSDFSISCLTRGEYGEQFQSLLQSETDLQKALSHCTDLTLRLFIEAKPKSDGGFLCLRCFTVRESVIDSSALKYLCNADLIDWTYLFSFLELFHTKYVQIRKISLIWILLIVGNLQTNFLFKSTFLLQYITVYWCSFSLVSLNCSSSLLVYLINVQIWWQWLAVAPFETLCTFAFNT